MKAAGYVPNKRNKKPVSKKAKLVTRIIISTFLIIALSFFTADYIRVKRHKIPPLFAIQVHAYDNGSADYYGLGYKVWKDYDSFDNETEYYLTFWLLPKFWSI